jgi:hypothetical protein
MSGSSVLALQTLLIGVLLAQRRRRRRAEEAIRTNAVVLRSSYERIRHRPIGSADAFGRR